MGRNNKGPRGRQRHDTETPRVRDRSTAQRSVRFRKNDIVGLPNAEADHKYLQHVFVDTGHVDVLRDVDDARCIVVGRTGAGKSALLLHLEAGLGNVSRIDPLTMPLQYISARTVIPALADAEVNLDPFFRFLWRHALTMEIIRAWRPAKSAVDWRSMKNFVLGRDANRDRAKKREKLLDEIERWAGDSWTDATSHTKAVITKFDREIRAKLGPDQVIQLESVAGRDASLAFPPPQPVDRRTTRDLAQSAVTNVISVQRASDAYEFLKEDVLADDQKRYYVVIDRVDDAWADSSFAYDMVDALVFVAGEFAELPNVKVIVALREDIVSNLRAQTNRSRQWEKYEGLFVPLRWTGTEITNLIDRRLTLLLKDRYGGKVQLHSLLPPPRPGMKGSTLDYVVRRTLLRPRDLIAFTNEMLAAMAAEDSDRLRWDILAQAEASYSRKRLEALENEWRLNHLGLMSAFEIFRGVRQPFTVADLDLERLVTALEQAETETTGLSVDGTHLLRDCHIVVKARQDYAAAWPVLLATLYKIGFIGAKFSPTTPLTYSYEASSRPFSPIGPDLRYQVHPAFWRALDIDGSGWVD